MPWSLMKPLWHFDRRAPNTPKRPFANVETQLKVPDPAIAAANVIAPLSGFTDALEVKPLPAAVVIGAPVTDVRASQFGVGCTTRAELTFNRRTAVVVLAWFYDRPADPPRLVTAYPSP